MPATRGGCCVGWGPSAGVACGGDMLEKGEACLAPTGGWAKRGPSRSRGRFFAGAQNDTGARGRGRMRASGYSALRGGVEEMRGEGVGGKAAGGEDEFVEYHRGLLEYSMVCPW
jgi:hypothetical protein